jgi:TM2 domain-containing membrane protein YozV
MATGSFGRKGTAAAVAPRRANLVAGAQPRSFQPMRDVADPAADAEARRAAFLAGERASQAAARPAAAETGLERLPRISEPPLPSDRSLRGAYFIWFFLGLAGGHRFYLRRPVTGAVQTLLFVACVGAVAIFQYYQAFAGLALSWLWYLIDGMRLRRLHLGSGRR